MMCNRCLERDGRGKNRGNSSCHFSDQYFLPSFLCKHPKIRME